MTASTAKRMCSRKRSTSRPTAICAIAPQMNTAVVSPPISTSEMLLTRSSTIFGSATDNVLNTSPAAQRDDDEKTEDGRRDGGRQRHVGRSAARGFVLRLVGNEPDIGGAGRDADDARHEEGAAPGQRGGEERGDPAASEMPRLPQTPLNAMRASAMGRALDHHRGADRMIDRGEDAEHEQRDGEHRQRRRQRRGDQRHAAADDRRRPSCCAGSNGRQASLPAARTSRRR